MNILSYLKGNARPILWLVLATLVLHLVLIQPNHPVAMTWGALLLFPLELPVIVFGLIALGHGRAGRIVRIVLCTVLTLIFVWKVADATMFAALNRGFNPLTDMFLVAAFTNLLSGTFGGLATVAAWSAAVLVTILVAVLLWWATGRWSRIDVTHLWRKGAGVCAILAASVASAEIGQAMGRWTLPQSPPGAAFTARLGLERVDLIRNTIDDIRAFRVAVETDDYADVDGLFDLLDRDTYIIYVESYGRTSFDTPQYADLHQGTLAVAQNELADLGLSMASVFVKSPTRGGQSWLAHSTFANGLWISDQSSYGAALASDRQTLFHLAQSAGFHTAAVMPQITLAWPESETMGFDTILAAADLGYKGLAFNWVTMPDQFTLNAMDGLLKDSAPDDAPLFVQVVLGSSHAPWVPVPEVIDWDDLGDGTIFNPIVQAADTPHVVWQDHDRVRLQYGLAVDYALQSVFSYIARRADEAPLILVVGDHQAAGFVALDERPDVPIHVIGPAHLVDLIAGPAFSAGLVPQASGDLEAMNIMRDHLIEALSSNPNSSAQP